MIFKLGLLKTEAFREHESVCKGQVYRVCEVYRVGSRGRLLETLEVCFVLEVQTAVKQSPRWFW